MQTVYGPHPHHRDRSAPAMMVAAPAPAGPTITAISVVDASHWDMTLSEPCYIDETQLGGVSLSNIMLAGGNGQMEPLDPSGVTHPGNVTASLPEPTRLRLTRLVGFPVDQDSICVYGPLRWLRSKASGTAVEGRRIDF